MATERGTDVAERFSHTTGGFRMLVHPFRQDPDREFFTTPRLRSSSRPADLEHDQIIKLRKQNLSIYDISESLKKEGFASGTLLPLAYPLVRKLNVLLRQNNDHSQPKQLYRKFVETSGTIEIAEGRKIIVTFDRRSHNPILREAQLDHDSPPIPWLGNRRVEYVFA